MQDVLFLLGDHRVTLFEALVAGGGLAVLLLGWLARRGRATPDRETERRLAELARLQAETVGRVQSMAEVLGSRQADLARLVGDRLDGLGQRLGHTLADTGRATHADLARLAERMAVIDRAQRGIGELSSRVVELQTILADKQARGAFGQARMETIVADALPPSAYAFQATLANGTRPDCLISMPNGAGGLAIDAKFPLESWTAWRAAETDEARTAAARGLRRDIGRHLADIAGKYLVPGETQDTAFLFVPSEAIFADLHEHFGDLVQQGHRMRVVIVSPSLLLLSIQMVQSVLRDQRIREEAHVIQAEVGLLIDDVTRLAERAAKLQAHFGQTARDLDQMTISLDKVTRRANRIESLDLGRPTDAPASAAPSAASPVAHRLAGE